MSGMPKLQLNPWFVAVFDMDARRVLEIIPWKQWMEQPISRRDEDSDVITDAVDEIDAYMQATKRLQEGADHE